MELIKNYTILKYLYKQSGLYEALNKTGWYIVDNIFPYATYSGPSGNVLDVLEFIFQTKPTLSSSTQTPLNIKVPSQKTLSIFIEYTPDSAVYLDTIKDEMCLNGVPVPGNNPDVYRARGLFLAFKFAADYLNNLNKPQKYYPKGRSYNYIDLIDRNGIHRKFRIEFRIDLIE